MKHKVSELEGRTLDAFVAKAEGCEVVLHARGQHAVRDGRGLLVLPARYSSDWQEGGPIIERERIMVADNLTGWDGVAGKHARQGFRAYIHWGVAHGGNLEGKFEAEGATYLIAAMRAYVASQLGDEVELTAS